MNNQRKLILGKEPFIRKADNPAYGTKIIMRDFILALLPLIIFAWIKNGLLPFINHDITSVWRMLYPLIFIIMGGLTAVIVEFVYYRFLLKDQNYKKTLKNSFGAIPGLLLAMILSISTPLWVLIIGVVFAVVIGKLLFGGFGNNIFNPALIGYLFLTAAYYSAISSGNGFLNPSEIIAGATPMTILKQDPIANVAVLINQYGLWKMFLGLVPGAIAETSALLCLVAMIFLIIRKVINWRIPAFFLGTVFVLTYIIGAFNGYGLSLEFALFSLFNGGLMFGAVFMATEPVTSPKTPNGKIIFAIGLGVLTVLFRFKGNMPEGVASSILIMNLFTVIIDRTSAKLRVSGNFKKMVLTYSLIGLLFAGIGVYAMSGYTTPNTDPIISLSTKAQDFNTLKFKYTFLVDGQEVVVTMDQQYTINQISVADYNNDEFKALFLTQINVNKMTSFVTAIQETETNLIVTVSSKGFASSILADIVFGADNKIASLTVNTENESYNDDYNDGWSIANGHPNAVLPPLIVANQDDLSAVTLVSGASVTSNAIITATKTAKDYLSSLTNNDNLRMTGKEQDYNTLGFVYIFRQGANRYVVKTDASYAITNAIDETLRTNFTTLINANLFSNYVESVELGVGFTKVTVVTGGYASEITSVVTFDDADVITAFTSNISGESFTDDYNSGYNTENGNPGTDIPASIITSQNDLSLVSVISGASVTSRSILAAAKLAMAYMEAQNG
ncbi:MAG: RnfABCDGE type electron transport complex subunit D [Bacilli bacterium]